MTRTLITRKIAIRRTRRRGAAAVEFAIAAPVLFTLLFAALELGRVNMIRQTANNAAYEGARQCVVPGAVAADGQTAAQAILSVVGITGATVTVTPSTIVSTTPDVTVQVSVPVSTNLWLQPIYTTATSITTKCKLTRDWAVSTKQSGS